MIWRVVHSSDGFQFRSTTGQVWPDEVFTRTDDYGLPLVGPLLPRDTQSDVEDETLERSAATTVDGTNTRTKRYAA